MEKDGRNIERKGIQSAKEKPKGIKGGRKCTKERKIARSPFSGHKGRGGNKSPDVLPAPLSVLAGNLSSRGGALLDPNLHLSAMSPSLLLHACNPHIHPESRWRRKGGMKATEAGVLSKNNQEEPVHHPPPKNTLCVCMCVCQGGHTTQIYLVFCVHLPYPK
jgi:hypothetical protein